MFYTCPVCINWVGWISTPTRYETLRHADGCWLWSNSRSEQPEDNSDDPDYWAERQREELLACNDYW